ncbi:contactin-associated protein-like 5, partial [Tachysurus ichikawai]
IDNTVMQQYSLSPGSALAPVRILTLGRIRGSDITDEEVVRAGLRGFVGCLSSVQFNQAAPLKAALQNRGSSAVSVHGRLEDSDCGAKSSTDTHIITHTGSGDESSKSDRDQAPLTKSAQSDSALIGGVVAAIVFMTLCVSAVLIRFLYQHREPQPLPAVAIKSKKPSLDLEPSKPNHVGKEYFI